MSVLHVDNPYTLASDVEVPLADDAHIGTVLDQARAAFAGFRATPIAERIALCEAAVKSMEGSADSIAADITRMMGKPLGQAKGEVGGMAGRARHMMEIAEGSLADLRLPPKDNFERRIAKTPLGVVVDLPAWNYPLLTAVNVVIPAILAGNAVIVKHSPRSPLCGEHFARAFAAAGAPANLVQALHCDHPASERMVGDPRIDSVFFTGSVYGGHRIQEAAARSFTHVDLELGGNDPAYVADDADIAKVAEQIVDGAMYNAGQSCCAVERVYVHAVTPSWSRPAARWWRDTSSAIRPTARRRSAPSPSRIIRGSWRLWWRTRSSRVRAWSPAEKRAPSTAAVASSSPPCSTG
jgi:acyl-CoA reductase-like NAD-dependent aldehyde dehydrogenase